MPTFRQKADAISKEMVRSMTFSEALEDILKDCTNEEAMEAIDTAIYQLVNEGTEDA